MPRYQYRCDRCGDFDRIMRVADHSRVVKCPCGMDAQQVITASTVLIPSHMSATGESAYESPATGRVITSNRERLNDLAESGCVEYDPGMKQDADRRRDAESKALDASIDDTVEREFAIMPSDKLERLTNEIERGADVSVERL